MFNSSIYSVLIPLESSLPSHTICSNQFEKIQPDIINALYDSLGKNLNYHEMVGAWIFDEIKPEEKDWKRSGIAILQSLTCYNANRVQDVFYDIYFILGKSQRSLPVLKIKKKNQIYVYSAPRIGFSQNPRHFNNYSKKVVPIFAKDVRLELVKSGKELIDPTSVYKFPEAKSKKQKNTDATGIDVKI